MNDQKLVERFRSEFLEMPGLSLTPAQVSRLWEWMPGRLGHSLTALIGAGMGPRRPRHRAGLTPEEHVRSHSRGAVLWAWTILERHRQVCP